MTSNITRRRFLGTALRGAGAASALAASPFPAPAIHRPGSPNERIRIGVVGIGTRGIDHLRSLGYPRKAKLGEITPIENTEVVAICDAFDEHLDAGVDRVAMSGGKAARYHDHREMLEREDLDLVVISTPDHLHVPIAIDAARAGCDVYVEKCLSNNVEEAFELERVLEETGRTVQVGLQLHQDRIHRLAAEVVESGALGEVHQVQTFFNRSGPGAAWNREIAKRGDALRDKIHWEQFLGPAPKREFDAHRFFEWRRFWDYSTGISGDLFSHVLGSVHAIMDLGFPTSVVGSGGVYHWRDGRETPDTFHAILEYADRNLSVTFLSSLSSQYQRHMTRILGTDAAMEVSWGLKVFPDRFSERYAEEIEAGTLSPNEPMLNITSEGTALASEAAPSELWLRGRGLTKTVRDGRIVGTTRLHHEDLIASVRAGKKPSASFDVALPSTVGCHMATASYRSGQRVGWDAEARRMTGLNGEPLTLPAND